MLNIVPDKVALQIQELMGSTQVDHSVPAVSNAVPPEPPPLLKLPDDRIGELRILRKEDVDALNRNGFVVVDRFLEDRCYASLGKERAAEAARIARAGAVQVPMRAARLGRGEGRWSSVAVRGDAMAWLSAPRGPGLQERAQQRVLQYGIDPLPCDDSSSRMETIPASGPSEFDAIGALLKSTYGGVDPPRSTAVDQRDEPGVESAQKTDEGRDAAYYEDLDVLLTRLVALQEELDRVLEFGSSRMSIMAARYPGGGARYARHRDALPEHTDARRLTATYYLNPDWGREHGGCFRAFLPEAIGRQVPDASPTAVETKAGGTDGSGLWAVDIEPVLDRLVLFSSAWLEHEVLPTHAERHTITAWLY